MTKPNRDCTFTLLQCFLCLEGFVMRQLNALQWRIKQLASFWSLRCKSDLLLLLLKMAGSAGFLSDKNDLLVCATSTQLSFSHFHFFSKSMKVSNMMWQVGKDFTVLKSLTLWARVHSCLHFAWIYTKIRECWMRIFERTAKTIHVSSLKKGSAMTLKSLPVDLNNTSSSPWHRVHSKRAAKCRSLLFLQIVTNCLKIGGKNVSREALILEWYLRFCHFCAKRCVADA